MVGAQIFVKGTGGQHVELGNARQQDGIPLFDDWKARVAHEQVTIFCGFNPSVQKRGIHQIGRREIVDPQQGLVLPIAAFTCHPGKTAHAKVLDEPRLESHLPGARKRLPSARTPQPGPYVTTALQFAEKLIPDLR